MVEGIHAFVNAAGNGDGSNEDDDNNDMKNNDDSKGSKHDKLPKYTIWDDRSDYLTRPQQ